MHSILFSLDPFVIHSFGACLAVAIILCYGIMVRLGKSSGYSSDFVSSLLSVLIVSGLIGGRIFYVAEHWSFYRENPSNIIMVQQGGLMFFGGFLIGGASLILFCKLNKKNVLDVLDLVVSAIPLGHALGRIGCFLNGCCYGKVSDSCLSVTFPHDSIPWSEQLNAALISSTAERSLPVLPSQLFEAALNFIIFLILIRRYKHRRHTGSQLALYMMLYAVARFAVEFSRADERLYFGPVSISQAISIGVFLAGLGLTVFLSRKPVQSPGGPAGKSPNQTP